MTIEGLFNFRDTGGTPLTSGGTSRSGVLFRSDAPSALTASGLAALAETPIGVVVDLRTPEERRASPDILPTSRPMKVAQLSILEGAMAQAMKELVQEGALPTPAIIEKQVASIPSLEEMYRDMLQGSAPLFADLARLVIAETDDAPTAVLIHCTAGKDRTGVATAVLLEAVGADRDAVIADYAESQDHLAGPWADGMMHMVESFGVPVTDKLRTLATGTPPEAMAATLAWLDSEYGGAAGYLSAAGLTADELDALRARLTG